MDPHCFKWSKHYLLKKFSIINLLISVIDDPLKSILIGLTSKQKRGLNDKFDYKAQLDALIWKIENLIIDGVPTGGEDDYVVLKEVGHKPNFDFQPRDHVELGELLDIIRKSHSEGMIDFTSSLVKLVEQEYVHVKVALEATPKPEELRMRLKGISQGASMVGKS